jgi:hypothetical protein
MRLSMIMLELVQHHILIGRNTLDIGNSISNLHNPYFIWYLSSINFQFDKLITPTSVLINKRKSFSFETEVNYSEVQDGPRPRKYDAIR